MRTERSDDIGYKVRARHEQNEVSKVLILIGHRRFPEITGEYNLTVFSYSGRVKSPESEAAAEKSRSATVLDLSLIHI